MITLLASTTQTADGTGSITIPNLALVESGIFLLQVTAAGALVGDLLDVYIQSTIEGTKWDDFIHFTQCLGNGGGKRHVARWVRNVMPTTPMGLLNDAALAAGVSQGPVGVTWRVKWVIADGGGTHSFTFNIVADLFRRKR